MPNSIKNDIIHCILLAEEKIKYFSELSNLLIESRVQKQTQNYAYMVNLGSRAILSKTFLLVTTYEY